MDEYLGELPSWTLLDGHIEKEMNFKSFRDVIDFVNKLTPIADAEDHHPDLLIWGYNKLKIMLMTHTIKGLSENDFILAAKIDSLV